ncbi:MAG: tetrahydromethanopterin S-methyltransferase subunit A [Methanosphaera sp.]|nr:tetrahydromethanopterin S-methyltransferase subunit A [Methanosphaera sp.]
MVDKSDVLDGWPFETGDYAVGDPSSSVAIVTLGSNMNDELVSSGCAIVGPLHTENLGIEKLVANIISNTNIRFLIICGSEVQGHITGKTVEALYSEGIDPEKKSIIGSPGAIPFVENLEVDAVDRFQDQVSLVSMINSEDIDAITESVQECISNDPGAYPEEPLLIELSESEDEEEDISTASTTTTSTGGNVDSSAIQLSLIDTRIKLMKTEVNQIASLQKYQTGYYAGKVEGVVIGFILTMVLLLIVIRGF